MAYLQWLNIIGLVGSIMGLVLLYRHIGPEAQDNYRLFLTPDDLQRATRPSKRKSSRDALSLALIVLGLGTQFVGVIAMMVSI